MRRFWSHTLALCLAVSLAAGVAPAATANASVDARAALSASVRDDPDVVPGVGTVAWGPCEDPALVAFNAECGMLSVPLDYADPDGTKIQLALSRVRHTVPDEQAQGIMLVNPGGPGGSGLIFSIFGAFVAENAGLAYDWIGFDPRGVGASVPRLSCIPDYFAGPRPPYEPTTPAIEDAWLVRSEDYARACAANGGELLDHVKTTDNAQDMNAIRSALGEVQINYYGFSYGTYIGQVFATLYPERVRRMVLDANVDPRRIWYDANLDQDVAFEKVMRLFFDWVARHESTYHLGSDADAVEAAYYRALTTLAASPRGALGSAEWADAFLVAGYSEFAWPAVAHAFAAFVNDDEPGPATALYESFDNPGDDNLYAMYLATECTDARWPRNWNVWRRDNSRTAAQAPFLTWGNVWFNAPCAFWAARPGHPVHVRGRDLPPILLLSETLDGATPFSGSLQVRRRFPSAVLVATDGGATHANSFGNPCAAGFVAAYLRDGTTPERLRGRAADVVCPALPQPDPTAPEQAAALLTPADAGLLAAPRLLAAPGSP